MSRRDGPLRAPFRAASPRGLPPLARASPDMKSARPLFGLLKDAGVRWSDDQCYRLGASLSYYAVFSIFPLLLLCVTAVGYVMGHDESVRDRLLDYVSRSGAPEMRPLLDQTLTSMQTHETARGVGALVGVVTLLFGASGVFSEL